MSEATTHRVFVRDEVSLYRSTSGSSSHEDVPSSTRESTMGWDFTTDPARSDEAVVISPYRTPPAAVLRCQSRHSCEGLRRVNSSPLLAHKNNSFVDTGKYFLKLDVNCEGDVEAGVEMEGSHSTNGCTNETMNGCVLSPPSLDDEAFPCTSLPMDQEDNASGSGLEHSTDDFVSFPSATTMTYHDAWLCTWRIFGYYAIPTTLFTLLILMLMVQFAIKPYLLDYQGTFSSLPSQKDRVQYIVFDYNTVSFVALLWVTILCYDFMEPHLSSRAKTIFYSANVASACFQVAVVYLDYYFMSHKLALAPAVLFFITAASNFTAVTYYAMTSPRNKVYGGGGNKQRWYHIPVCCACMFSEVVYGYMLIRWRDYTSSDYFSWTSLFLASIFSVVTRYCAHLTELPPTSSYKLCVVSFGISGFFFRVAQNQNIVNVPYFLGLEVFYHVSELLLRVTLYYRHALVYYWSKHSFQLVVPRTTHGQQITTRLVMTFYVGDVVFGVTTLSARFLVDDGSVVPPGVFTALVLFCVSCVVASSFVAILIIGRYEHIVTEDFHVLSQPYGREGIRTLLFYMGSCAIATTTYASLAVQIWKPEAQWDLAG